MKNLSNLPPGVTDQMIEDAQSDGTLTYTEIHDKVYTEGMVLNSEDKLPWRIIRFFQERKFFGDWWGNIDPEIQDEIYNELRRLCEANK